MTHQRHSPCTAAMVLMRDLSLSKYSFNPVQCCLVSLGADMRRREFISLLGSAAAWPLAARAQQPAMPLIGFLNSSSPDVDGDRMRAYRQGLSDSGYIEGRNVMIEYRWADGHNDRLPSLAADLVHRGLSVIVTGGTPATLAAKAATTTIPIVFIVSTDPVEAGLVASLNRPGGNLTGITGLNVELAPKKLELVHELLPATSIMALLINPTNPIAAERQSRDVEAAARKLGVQLHVLEASTDSDFDPVFARLAQLQAGALVIGSDLFFTSHSKQLAALAFHHRVASIYQFREFAAAGGLMGYGGSVTDWGRQGAIHTAKILAGAKPSELPVQQSTKVELIINMKTAQALGLTFPITLLGRADEVIE
jgi:putative ABC transport system substrate-binding protein